MRNFNPCDYEKLRDKGITESIAESSFDKMFSEYVEVNGLSVDVSRATSPNVAEGFIVFVRARQRGKGD